MDLFDVLRVRLKNACAGVLALVLVHVPQPDGLVAAARRNEIPWKILTNLFALFRTELTQREVKHFGYKYYTFKISFYYLRS